MIGFSFGRLSLNIVFSYVVLLNGSAVMSLAIKIHPFFDVLKTRFLFRAFLFIVRLMMTRNNCQFTEFVN